MAKIQLPTKGTASLQGEKLGQAKGWDNVMADIGNGKRENLVIQKCHLCIFTSQGKDIFIQCNNPGHIKVNFQ